MPDMPKCPECGAGWSRKPHNRLGWFYCECGRRYHPGRKHWEPSYGSRCCLSRQLDQARGQLLLLARLAADKPQFYNPLDVYDAKKIRDRVLKENDDA